MTAQGDPLTAAMVLFCAVVAPVLLVVSIAISGWATFWG
jgi:paraquat-inducible protein A